MITGKKAVAIDIAYYNDDDEALEADLKLADSQPIICGVRAPDTHKYSVNWPKGVLLYKYDGDAGKYLLGVRYPMDQGLQSKPFTIADYALAKDPNNVTPKELAGMSHAALNLTSFKENVEFIVKTLNNDDAEIRL